MELEFAIDPLFKKASADFDEGGAKGLLLNHLAIDALGRIVFDSSDDAHDIAEQDINKEEEDSNPDKTVDTAEGQPNSDIDSGILGFCIDDLGSKYFPDLNVLDEQDVCPSLKTFELGDDDGSVDLPFIKAPEDWRPDSHPGTQANGEYAYPADDDGHAGVFDEEDNPLGDLDIADGVHFGEGGEKWAREVALEPHMRFHVMQSLEGDAQGEDDMEGDGLKPSDKYAMSIKLGEGQQQRNILDYFDRALQKNWAGPEHWKIRKVKDAAKAAINGSAKRKEREPFEIDFAAPMSQALTDALYAPSPSNNAISLPKAQWRSKTRNLLPDDKHFSSRQLLRLFLKPKASLDTRKSGSKNGLPPSLLPEGEVDEQFWARQEPTTGAAGNDAVATVGNYDADFFQDDGFGPMDGADDDGDDDEFADARDHFSPQVEGGAANGETGTLGGGAFGAQLVTQTRRLRPEYVQYARVAKKVDVRRLKEEIWRSLALDEVNFLEPSTSAANVFARSRIRNRSSLR
jgi:condensin complex subunit 2